MRQQSNKLCTKTTNLVITFRGPFFDLLESLARFISLPSTLDDPLRDDVVEGERSIFGSSIFGGVDEELRGEFASMLGREGADVGGQVLHGRQEDEAGEDEIKTGREKPANPQQRQIVV